MLTLNIKGVESFDDETQTFVRPADVTLTFEHSLDSLSKWEQKHEKPFLSQDAKSSEEVYGYIRAMCLEGEITDDLLARFTTEDFKAINAYIESKMTATWFRETEQPRGYNAEVVTSEVIYHWIVALDIDWQAQYWHLNRLITLVKTINEKNKAASDTKRKAPTSAQMSDRRALMAKRRAESAARQQEGP